MNTSMNVKALNTRVVALALMLSAGHAAAVSNSLAVTDFNGDGMLDTAVVNSDFALNQNTLTISFGNGKGSFEPGAIYGLAEPFNIAAGDLNGDGKGDIAISSRDGIWVFHGDGAGGFVGGATLAGSGKLQLGDVNRDGLLDVITYSTPLYNPAGASVFFGTGNGSFSPEVKVVEAIGEASSFDSMVAGDLTGDGNLDLVFYSQFGKIGFAIGSDSGKFAVQPTIELRANEGAMSIAIGDFTGDRVPDLVVQTEERSVSVYAGDGTTFSRYTDLPFKTERDAFANPIAMGDFNLDGVTDVILLDSATGEVKLGINVVF